MMEKNLKRKLKNGKFIDEKIVLELKAKGLRARAIAKVLDCSITPVLRIIKNSNGKVG
jgi:DNA-binding CsgD family transcriptional regulator